MIFSSINLKNELATISQKHPDNLLDEVNSLLKHAAAADEKILQHFPNISHIGNAAQNQQTLPLQQVYTTQQIKQLCVKFRLRFLPSTLYKGELPYEAIEAIKDFENQYQPAVSEFHIVAPAEFFKLKDRFADPLLFAHLGNGNYYLLHQWGADFKPYAPALKYPFRNLESTAIVSVILGVLFTALLFVSGAVQYKTPAMALFYFSSIGFISSIFFSVLALIYGLVTYNDFSDETWNSKYFN